MHSMKHLTMPLYILQAVGLWIILVAMACSTRVAAAAGNVDVSQLSSPAFSPCDCDLTSACDPSCCCDPDCARLGITPTGQSCASMSWSETVPDSSFEHGQCVGSLVSVAPSVWSSLLTRQNGARVCAVRNNHPSMGDYYTTTPSVLSTSAALNQLLGSPSTSLLSSPPDLPTGSAYQRGSLIHAVFGNTRRAFTLSGSSASIGLAMDSSSACLQAVARPFLSSSYMSTCSRELPTSSASSLASICQRNSPLDIATFLPDSLLATPLASNPTRVPITLNRAYACPNASCPDTPSTAVPALANGNTTCENVVTDVHFTVSYGKTGDDGWQVTKVVVDWAVKSWDLPSTSSVPPVIGQSFGLAFVAEDLSSTSTLSTRSGNPGYIESFPVLFLRNSTSPPSLAALALPSQDPQSGACQLSSSTSTSTFPPYLALHQQHPPPNLWPAAPSLIRFLASSHSSCGIPWSSTPSTPAACARLQSWYPDISLATHVAMFGNQTTEASQASWVPMVLDQSIPGLDGTSGCSVATQVVLDLVWAVVGSVRAPQAAIVGARLRRGRFRTVGSSLTGAGSGSTAADLAPVTFSVKWTRARPKDVELETWYPPTPQLFPPVPKDWMYPFA